METNTDIIIAGAGLAGLTAAIHLLKSGYRVQLIEKNSYPQHKVCGEYISNEVLPYLEWLGLDIDALSPTRISEFQFSAVTGETLEARLPLGGFGISRYTLDHFLYEQALQMGARFIQDTVTDIRYNAGEFTVSLLGKQVLRAGYVIGAYGKRDALDQKLSRDFIRKKSPWLAVKAHYEGEFPDNLIALHHFEGGYCGVSRVEKQRINICYLVDYATFKRFKNIPEHRAQVVCKNPQLQEIFNRSTMLNAQPVSISQISFEHKKAVEKHVLMIGDTAGLIHPLCGNGMAMAIHSAKLCAELLIHRLEGKIPNRETLERDYQRAWNKQFRKRLFIGRIISKLLSGRQLSGLLIRTFIKLPSLLPVLIRQTHGKPLMQTS